MQTHEKNSTLDKTPKQLIAELKNQEIAKVVLDMDQYYGSGLRPYQDSIHYCIYALSVLDKESELTESETVEHIGALYTLATYLRTMEDIISAKNISHE